MEFKINLRPKVIFILIMLMIIVGLQSCGSSGGGGGDGKHNKTTSENNNVPEAKAGQDQTVTIGTLVTLDGRGSSDTDGDTLTYNWAMTSKPAGTTATLSNATSSQPTFTPDKDGTYVISLVVNDGKMNSETDTVTITIVASNTNTSPQILASGLKNPYEIAVDAGNVYWTEPGSNSIKKISINGGTITTLATGINNPSGIAVDAANVYWTEYTGGTVKKVSINGGTPTTLASGLSNPTSIAVDATNAYWTEYNGKSIKKVGINGGMVTTLVSGLTDSPSGLLVASNTVFWVEYSTSNIKKVQINGGTVTTIASGQKNPSGIAIDASNVYFTEYSGGTVKKVDINGGTSTIIASGLSNPNSIAVDATHVYWTEYNGKTVMKVGINGGTVTTIASDLNSPGSIAIDSTNVYWAEYSAGMIKKVDKSNVVNTIIKTISGSVSGLTGSGLVLQNNGSDDLTFAAGSSSFTFATQVAEGMGYNITVKTQPAGQTCTVSNGTGTVGTTNVTNVIVTCSGGSNTTTDPLSFAKSMVVGGWYFKDMSCSPWPDPRVELSGFFCPAGRLRGVEKFIDPGGYFEKLEYVAKGTWSITSTPPPDDAYASLILDYTTTINIEGVIDTSPGILAQDPGYMMYIPDGDYIMYYYNKCWARMMRMIDGSNKDVDDSYCGSSSGGKGVDQCGTDSDCGRCWYCDKSGSDNICRYGGEGPYGCYRGWEP